MRTEERRTTDITRVLYWIALVLVVIGALNWGLVGLFRFDLVAAIFGGVDSAVARLVYILVGLSGIVLAVTSARAETAHHPHAPVPSPR